MIGDVYTYLASLGYDFTQKKSQPGQRINKKNKKNKRLRTGLLNRLKMRMLSALKGEQYR